jgi:putative ABC transport system substrate-binding protein
MTRRLIGLLVTLGLLVVLSQTEAASAGKIARIGLLLADAPPPEAHRQPSPLQQALRELGWVEGENVLFESRFADGALNRLLALAAELVHLKADLIAASGAIAIRAAPGETA